MKKYTKIDFPFGKIFPAEQTFYDCSGQTICQYGEIWKIDTVTTALVTDRKEYTPKLLQSCMNPEIITVIPLHLEIDTIQKKILIVQQNTKEEVYYEKEQVFTRLWQGSLLKRGCENCKGCGRC